MQLPDRRERANAPLLEGVATRPEAAVLAAQHRRFGSGRYDDGVAGDARDRDRVLAGEDGQACTFEPGELLEGRLARTQRAMGNQRGENIAEIVEDRLN